MNFEDAKAFLNSHDKEGRIKVLKFLADATMSGHDKSHAQRILLYCLDKIDSLEPDEIPVLRDLLDDFGYFPYVEKFSNPSLLNGLHVEYFRADGLTDKVFHREQHLIADKLLRKESVVLSAPTSFGKSILIDEVVAANIYKNIVIVQPTLALIDETRQKLANTTSRYKIVFSTNQKPDERNLFILTPERVIEYTNLPKIDFFVVDEFYKLHPNREDNRWAVLNHAVYMLLQHTNSFYFLGPNIKSIPSQFEEKYNTKLVRSDVETVVQDLRILTPKNAQDKFTQLNELLLSLDEPTIVYCKSPEAAETYAKQFLPLVMNQHVNLNADAVQWIQVNIHSEWFLISCLKSGLGFHHGALPRFLGKFVINAFNHGSIRYLFCTSTLIEGVNTVAKNIVIYDHQKANKNIDAFDFANIAGRAGRMNKYVSGGVFSFGPKPVDQDFVVDFPWLTQTDASDEVLIQLDRSDLTEQSRNRIGDLLTEEILPLTILRTNSNISPQGQINLALYIRGHLNDAHVHLSWDNFPTYEQLQYSCELIWEHLNPGKEAGIWTGRMLAFSINRYYLHISTPQLIRNMLLDTNKDGSKKYLTVDAAIRDTFNQTRKWFEFKVPKYFRALEMIQHYIFMENRLTPGNYTRFAAAIESGFLPSHLASLREFGIPAQLIRKLEPHLTDCTDIDQTLSAIRQLRDNGYRGVQLDSFEVFLLSSI